MAETVVSRSERRPTGIYIPPNRISLDERKESLDRRSVEYQKLNWESLRKKINGIVNKVSAGNIKDIIFDLFKLNIIRGRGLLCRSLIKSQSISPNFTPIYASLVAIVNSRFPDIGRLLIVRLIDILKKAYRRNDKKNLVSSTKFIAHLFNQYVIGPLIPLEILALFLQSPTDDSIEISVYFVQEIGQRLSEVSPQGYNGIFERFRSILHEGDTDKRVQYLIEGLFAVRRQEYKDFPAIPDELDLVEEGDQNIHLQLSLDDNIDIESELDFFNYDENFIENEQKYEEIRKDILGESDEESSESESESEEPETMEIEDRTGTESLQIKKAIYLAIMSSFTFDECAHKLLKMNVDTDHLCQMIIECCAQEKTYLRSYSLVAERFCSLEFKYKDKFTSLFEKQYNTIHRYETNKLRNVAKFFAHLLFTDSIPWSVLKCVRITEKDTTSSSRIFLKILFLEIAEYWGVSKLDARLKEPELQPYLTGVFPIDDLRNTRFSINYFTAINLGILTEGMRDFLEKNKHLMNKKVESDSDSSDSDSSDSDSDSDSDSSNSDSDSDSDSSSDSSDSDSSDSDSDSDSDYTSSSSSSSSSDSRRYRRRSRSRSSERRYKRRKHN